MNDEQIYNRGGSDEDIKSYAEANGADLHHPTKQPEQNNLDSEWEKEFSYKFAVMLERSLYTDEEIEEVYSFISNLLQSEREKAVAAENKEWREGRRCEICGIPKDPNLTTMCSNCLETQ